MAYCCDISVDLSCKFRLIYQCDAMRTQPPEKIYYIDRASRENAIIAVTESISSMTGYRTGFDSGQLQAPLHMLPSRYIQNHIVMDDMQRESF